VQKTTGCSRATVAKIAKRVAAAASTSARPQKITLRPADPKVFDDETAFTSVQWSTAAYAGLNASRRRLVALQRVQLHTRPRRWAMQMAFLSTLGVALSARRLIGVQASPSNGDAEARTGKAETG
jgi:hypothetical protein